MKKPLLFPSACGDWDICECAPDRRIRSLSQRLSSYEIRFTSSRFKLSRYLSFC